MKQPFRGGLRLAILAVATLAGGWAVAQTIDDVPPAVQNNVPPNFMFMIDNSGSMSNIVLGAPYDPAIEYTVCPATKKLSNASEVQLYLVSGVPFISGTSVKHTTFSTASSARCFGTTDVYDAKLLADTGSGTKSPGSYLSAQYTGNYLNWYFGNFNGVASSGWVDRRPGTQTRMEVAKASTKTAVNNLPLPSSSGKVAVRVGLGTYRSTSDGGWVRTLIQDFNSTLKTSLQTTIDGLTPQSATPLASTLADLARYIAMSPDQNISINPRSDSSASAVSVKINTVLKLDSRDACPVGPTGSAMTCTTSNPPTSSQAAAQPIQAWCQRSSIFMVTDGRPQGDKVFANNVYLRDYDGDCSGTNASRCDGNPDVNNGAAGNLAGWDRKEIGVAGPNGYQYSYEQNGSDYMDDIALMLYETDLRPDLTKPAVTGNRAAAKNNITTYMIGFADDFVRNDPLLANTARQGGGRFIAATDGPALEKAFDSVIQDAISLDAAAAAVAVTNAQITSGTVGYASSYVSGDWAGDLEAYALDITTGLQSGAAQWKARDKLNAQLAASGGDANRKIVTYTGSAGIAFTTGNASSFRGGASSLTDAVINYTRGSRVGEGTTLRQRNYILGDIINAEPVVVNYAGGNPVVFQAANDGMLHVFDGRIGVAAGGTELWAYVPKLIHSQLAGRAAVSGFQHKYLVDGTPVVADVTGVTASGSRSVSKILVGGLGKGGAGYYALDISSGTAADETAAASKVLWEFTDSNMGYSFGPPLIVNTANGWRVIVASGYQTDGLGGDGRGRVWVLDPANGTVDKTFRTPGSFSSASNTLGLAYLSKPQNLTGDAVVRYVYGGDLKGNVWRVDLNASNNSDLVQIGAVADGGSPAKAQPISSAPVVSPVAGSATKYLVYFGTGQYFSVDDVPGTASANTWSSQRQTIYGLVDDTSVASPTLPNIRGSNGTTCPTVGSSAGGNGDLVCQLATGPTVTHHPVDLSVKRGFYVDIPIAGGRVNTQAALTAGGTLVMIVNVPTNAQCDPGGSSYMFQLSGATGGAIVKTYGGSVYYDAIFLVGNALSSRPVIVITSTGPRALLRMSDKETESVSINETAGSAPAFRRIYMRPLN